MKPQTKEPVRPLRSGSKVQNTMKLPGPPKKILKMTPEVEDLSILKKSVDTSVTSPLEIFKICQTGTPELMETLKNECSMIYECKICRNLFRSIANFICHKRNYCTTKFYQQASSQDSTLTLEHSLIVGSQKGTVTTSRKTTRRDILSLLDNFQERMAEVKDGHVFTEIPESNAAVFNSTQSSSTLLKDESPNSKHAVVVGPTGRIIGSTQDNGTTTHCKSCGESIKDIRTHLSMCKSVLKQCFGCPLCDKYFTTAWAVYRHLKKVHGKSTEQVKKLRNVITKLELPVDQKLRRQSVILAASNSSTNDKGWLVDLEKNGVDGMYKCYICNKQFERRAVLLAHMQMCEKKKPSTGVIESKKNIPGTPNHEKNHSAAIQVRVCYKKDAFVDKLNDCRVVAMRLSDEDTIAALSDQNKERAMKKVANNAITIYNNKDNNALSDNGQIGKNQDESIENEDRLVHDEGIDKEGIEEEVIDRIEELIEDEVDEMQNGDEVNLPSQDIFASQSNSVNHLDDVEVVPPSVDSESETNLADSTILTIDSECEPSIAEETVITNGFLSSPSSSVKVSASPMLSSPSKPCNGWSSLENDQDKDNFYSAFIESDGNDQSVESECGEAVPDEINNEIDSLAITRIICGSVKTVARESDDESVDYVEKELGNNDSRTFFTGKPTMSVSTEMSFDFEVEHDIDIDSDGDQEEVNLSFGNFISKNDGICLICNTKLAEKDSWSHVANHLLIRCYGCAIPTCEMKSYLRSAVVDHIHSEHKIEYAAGLIRNLNREEYLKPNHENDFLGFEISNHGMNNYHCEYLNSLRDNFGVNLEEEEVSSSY